MVGSRHIIQCSIRSLWLLLCCGRPRTLEVGVTVWVWLHMHISRKICRSDSPAPTTTGKIPTHINRQHYHSHWSTSAMLKCSPKVRVSTYRMSLCGNPAINTQCSVRGISPTGMTLVVVLGGWISKMGTVVYCQRWMHVLCTCMNRWHFRSVLWLHRSRCYMPIQLDCMSVGSPSGYHVQCTCTAVPTVFPSAVHWLTLTLAGSHRISYAYSIHVQ